MLPDSECPVRSTSFGSTLKTLGESASGWRFSGREADFALSVSETSQRIDQQQHIAALIAEEFGDGRAEVSGSQSECWCLIAGCDDDHAATQAFRAESFFEELTHFAAAFADEHDDVDVCLAAASDLAEQCALADAATGEESDALAFAAGQQSVDRTDAGAEWFGDSLPTHRRGRCARTANGDAAARACRRYRGSRRVR